MIELFFACAIGAAIILTVMWFVMTLRTAWLIIVAIGSLVLLLAKLCVASLIAVCRVAEWHRLNVTANPSQCTEHQGGNIINLQDYLRGKSVKA